MKRQARDWVKISVKYLSDKRLLSRIYRHFVTQYLENKVQQSKRFEKNTEKNRFINKCQSQEDQQNKTNKNREMNESRGESEVWKLTYTNF